MAVVNAQPEYLALDAVLTKLTFPFSLYVGDADPNPIDQGYSISLDDFMDIQKFQVADPIRLPQFMRTMETP